MTQPFSIRNHSRSSFSSHGDLEVWPEGAVIRYNVAGPFNLEAIKAFGRAVQALLGNWRPDGPFVTVSNWQVSMMATPDALLAFETLIRNGRAVFPRELMNIWHVPAEIEGRAIMLPKWRRLYDQSDFALEVVTSEAAALERARWYLAQAASGTAARG